MPNQSANMDGGYSTVHTWTLQVDRRCLPCFSFSLFFWLSPTTPVCSIRTMRELVGVFFLGSEIRCNNNVGFDAEGKVDRTKRCARAGRTWEGQVNAKKKHGYVGRYSVLRTRYRLPGLQGQLMSKQGSMRYIHILQELTTPAST